MSRAETAAAGAAERQITFCDALNEAMAQEMERDSGVFTYGIGVPDHKRIFGSTNGLVEKFGPERCFDTPLSEDALTGFAIGAAMNGLRPVFVHSRADFGMLSMNQLVNVAASLRYSSGGRLKAPLVIRMIIGRGWGQGFQHSKTMQSMLAHVPGLKVVMPTTTYDAKGMLAAAIRDEDPVIFFEHRWLYWQKGAVPAAPFVATLDKCAVLRLGRDATIVASSWMNVEASHAATLLAARGVELEIIDVRSIAPLDSETIIASVAKTGRCIVADYDWLHCGFGAEVAAQVSHACFGSLKSPVERLGFAPTPCPTTRCLEKDFYPNAGHIVRTVEKMLGLQAMPLNEDEFFSHERKFTGPF